MNGEAGNRRRAVGRGAPVAPPNRFETTRLVDDFDQLEPTDETNDPTAERRIATVFLPDVTKTIITSNDSPDVSFRFSINPYRGCEHGCAYCYARPGHEYLGLNAGIDFETKVFVKHDAAKLLRRELAKPSWTGEFIAISGVTDCYQPIERKLGITRACLEVLAEARQPCGIITKNALVVRDLDILARMAAEGVVHVNVSVTTLDQQLASKLEPRTASPEARLKAIRELSAAGVPVRVMTAPIIPGLNDQEIPAILTAAKEAGAKGAGWVLVRLPHAVRPIFEDWLDRHAPLAKPRIEALIRETRGGKLTDPRFGSRMRGDGAYAKGIEQTYKVFAKKLGLDGPMPPLDYSKFRPPNTDDNQRRLF